MSETEAIDGGEIKPIVFTQDMFPWLKYPQTDKLVSLVAADMKTIGWIGSCIEPESELEEVARRLNTEETKRANGFYLLRARAFIAGERTHLMHSINSPKSDLPIVCLVDKKLRVFFAYFGLRDRDGNDRMAIVKIAVCRKIDEDRVLHNISNNPRANIR